MLIKFLFGFLLVLAGLTTHSQGPPIFTDTPIMLGLEGRGVRTFGQYVSRENGWAYVHPLAVPYNITHKWQAGLVVPFVSRFPDKAASRSGIGDLSLFTKYQIYKKDGKAKTLRSLLKLTETFPSGDTDELPRLGRGVYQTTVSLVNGYVTTKYGIYGEFGYNITSDRLPDNFIYNLAFGYPLLPQQYPPKQVNLYLELLGNYIFDDIGNNLFLAPGVQYIASRKLLVESGVQIPLDESVEDNMETNLKLILGARILIF